MMMRLVAAVAVVAATIAAPAEGAGCPGVRRAGRWTTIDAPSALVAATLQIYGLSRTPLAADPADARRMYLAVGRQLHRTVDGGCTWQVTLDLGVHGETTNLHRANPTYEIVQVVASGKQYVHALLIDPTSSLTMAQPAYVATSTDGGGTWQIPQPVPPSEVPLCTAARLSVSAGDPRVAYLDCSSNSLALIFVSSIAGSGVYSTTDSGRTWRKTTATGYIPQYASVNAGFAIDPLDPRKLWYANGPELGQPDVYHSADGGDTWKSVWHGSGIGKHFVGMTALHEKGRPARVMFASTAGIVESLDGGKRWRVIRPSLPADKEGPLQSAWYERGATSIFAVAAYGVGYSTGEPYPTCTQGQRVSRYDMKRGRWQELAAPASSPQNKILQFRSPATGKGHYAVLVRAFATKADCDANANPKVYVMTYAD